MDFNSSSIALAVFLIGVAGPLYAYIGYPVLLSFLSLFVRRKQPDSYLPAVSVLIAAYNEEKAIAAKIRETLGLDYPPDKLEILVVSDGSTDQTDEIVNSFTDPRVRLLRLEGRKGKTNGQNEGVQLCRGEVIVFSDATATYHRESIRRLATHYSDPSVGAVSGRYKYFEAEGATATGLGSMAFWNYENIIKLLQSRLGTLTGCSGCIYSVRKSSYVALPLDACSDLVEPLHIVKNGGRIAFEPSALAHEETTASSAQEFRMRVRVATRGMRGVLSVSELLKPWQHPWTAFQLFSHKIMRWLVPVFLGLILLSSAVLAWGNTAFRILLILQLLFYGFALLTLIVPLHHRWRPLGLPLFFCTLNTAAAVGLWEVARGRQYTTWETVRSASPKLQHSTATGDKHS